MAVFGIVGATGVVGEEVISLLNSQFNVEFDNIKLYASKKSVGTEINIRGKIYSVEELTEESFKEVDCAILASSSEISRLCYSYAKNSCVMIDNSAAFRMDERFPLVIPEINMDKINTTRESPYVIANPNCSTIIMLMVLAPLHKINPIKRIDVSTYQAASGAGREAMDELRKQIKDMSDGNELTTDIFGRQYLMNAFVHNSSRDKDGRCGEEVKMIQETFKILNTREIEIYPTCVRIPTVRCHMESITVTFENSFSIDKIEKILEDSEGIVLDDDPQPIDYEGTNNIGVGYFRKSLFNDKTFSMVVVGDQILKGAALNAIQILNKL